MRSHSLTGRVPMWPAGVAAAVVGVLGAVTAPARQRADVRARARRQALAEQALRDARAELAAAREAA